MTRIDDAARRVQEYMALPDVDDDEHTTPDAAEPSTFEDAAHAEAQRQLAEAFPLRSDPAVARLVTNIVDTVAALARDRLATQEPSEVEVEAAKQAADDHSIDVKHYRDGEIRWEGCSTCDMEISDYDEQERHTARAALRAAARVRQEAGS